MYKCFSFVTARGERLSISEMISKLEARKSEGRTLLYNIGLIQTGVATASIGVTQLKSIQDISTYGKLLKLAPKALRQCKNDVDMVIEQSQDMIDLFNSYKSRGLDVDGKRSSDTVLILPVDASDQLPQTFQRLEYFNF